MKRVLAALQAWALLFAFLLAPSASVAELRAMPSASVVLLAGSWIAVAAPVDTTEDILATITVPANMIGPNGTVRIQALFTATNNANAKSFRARFSGIGGTAFFSTTITTQQSVWVTVYIANRNATNSQAGGFSEILGSGSSASSTAAATSAVDTTASTTIVLTAQKATSSDTAQLEGYTAEVLH